MISKTLLFSTLLISNFFGLLAHASERVDHFEGDSAATWSEAITLLNKANQELAQIAKTGQLSHQDSARIHQLSYSMENALATLSAQLNTTSQVLEQLHLSSETPELGQTKQLQQLYLETVAPITKHLNNVE